MYAKVPKIKKIANKVVASSIIQSSLSFYHAYVFHDIYPFVSWLAPYDYHYTLLSDRREISDISRDILRLNVLHVFDNIPANNISRGLV